MEGSLTKITVMCLFLSLGFEMTVNKSKEKRRHFRIALYEESFAQQFIKSPNGTIIGYSGFSFESMDWISKRLNFTYTIQPVDDYKMELLPNGTWVGSIVPLLRKEVDYLFNSILVSHTISKYVEYSATSKAEPIVLYTTPPYEESRLLALIKPFSLTVWLILIAFTGFMSVALYYVFVAETYLPLTGKPKKIQKPDDVLESSFRVFMGQSGFQEIYYSSLAKRLCIAVWCLAAIIFVNTYTTSFISYATVPRLIYPAKSIEDVAYRSNLKLVLIGTNRVPFFYNSTSPSHKKLGDELMKHPENILSRYPPLTAKIATGCCVGLLNDWLLKILLTQDYEQTGKCRATIAKEPQYFEHYAYAGQKGDPFMKNISKEVLWIKAHGFIHPTFYAKIKLARQCAVNPPPKVRPLRLADLLSVFLILIFGYVLSAIAFVVEVCIGKKRKKMMNQKK